MQRQISNSDRGMLGSVASHFGAILVFAAALLLSACDTGSSTRVTDVSQAEPGKDGEAPVLVEVIALPDGKVEPGDIVRIDFTASEALMTPVVFINGVRADVTGRIADWSAVRTMSDTDPDGFVTFSISYQDISGELGQAVTTTTDGSAACIGPDCPTDGLGPLEGHWKLNFAGVGPVPEDTTWFSIEDSGPDGERYCWFDDTYYFGGDGSFANFQGDETWVEDWQGSNPAACGAPVAPHDGSNDAVFQYDEDEGTLKLTGQGAFLGLAKVINGGELLTPADAPESVTYDVVQLVGDSLTVRIDYGGGVWEFRFTRVSNLPIVGNWRLNFAGVGPTAGDTSWFSIADTGPAGERACWFDDVYNFGGDGSFRNFQEGETWIEDWQGSNPAACGAPVAPHDGSTVGAWYRGDDTVTLLGRGSFLGLAKVFDGGELTDPADAPDSITYDVVELVGDSLTIRVNYGGGVWEFRFDRIPSIDLSGNWKLDFAGVGPVPEDTTWFSIEDSGPDGERYCWFNDTYQFGRDGSFANVQGDETWIEDWQGSNPAACGAPVAPHDGSNDAVFQYDEDEGTLRLTGQGAFLGLAKVINGGELLTPADAPEFVTYDVVQLVGDSLTVRIDYGGGVWEFRLSRLSNLPIVGNWTLDFAGVGPTAGDTSWFSIADTGPAGERACWFDDVYNFGADGSFRNFQEGETWIEDWQGSNPAACGAPVAPHDGSMVGAWYRGDDTVTLLGRGSFLGLAKVFDGGELTDPADAPDSITYDVVELVGDSAKIRVNYGGGVWEYDLIRR